MKNIKVIGLAGTRGVGKDTFFSLLKERNPVFERYAFADALKGDLAHFIHKHFGFSIGDCTSEQKEIIRPILIAYGCAQRAINIDHWANKVCKQIKEEWDGTDSPNWIPVVTDVRFENEVEVMRKNFGDNFILVNIARDDAPPPTDEEQKHYRKVAKMANYHMVWGGNDKTQQLYYADLFLETHFKQ